MASRGTLDMTQATTMPQIFGNPSPEVQKGQFHKNENKFKCYQCDELFHTPGNRLKHMVKVHKEGSQDIPIKLMPGDTNPKNPLKCAYCGKVSGTY